jgi:hypothetical protein
MTVTHNLKTWPKPFAALVKGIKRFEWRFDDRLYQLGHVLHLFEYDPEVHLFTGASVKATVTYLLTWGPGISRGYLVMSITKPEQQFNVKPEEAARLCGGET